MVDGQVDELLLMWWPKHVHEDASGGYVSGEHLHFPCPPEVHCLRCGPLGTCIVWRLPEHACGHEAESFREASSLLSQIMFKLA